MNKNLILLYLYNIHNNLIFLTKFNIYEEGRGKSRLDLIEYQINIVNALHLLSHNNFKMFRWK